MGISDRAMLAALALVTMVYAGSFFLPVLPPSRDALDLNPDAPAMNGLEVVGWCTRLLMHQNRVIATLAIVALLASNAGVVAAWTTASGFRLGRVARWVAIVCAAVGLGPGRSASGTGRASSSALGTSPGSVR